MRVWKVRPPTQAEGLWEAELGGEWGRGDATVGRVEVSYGFPADAGSSFIDPYMLPSGGYQWNVTGSILSVSSEDGQVKLYKGISNFSFPYVSLRDYPLTYRFRTFSYCPVATFAGEWSCMGSFSAEEPAENHGDMSDEPDTSGMMQE